MTRLERTLLWALVVGVAYRFAFDWYWSGQPGHER